MLTSTGSTAPTSSTLMCWMSTPSLRPSEPQTLPFAALTTLTVLEACAWSVRELSRIAHTREPLALYDRYHKLTYLVPSVESSIPIIEFKKWVHLERQSLGGRMCVGWLRGGLEVPLGQFPAFRAFRNAGSFAALYCQAMVVMPAPKEVEILEGLPEKPLVALSAFQQDTCLDGEGAGK